MDEETNDWTEYERERLLRIAQNNALIASLGLQVEDTPSVRSATSKTSKPASKKTTPKRKREDVDDTSVRRRSSRLMGMEAEGEAAVEFQKQETLAREEERKAARKVRAPRMKLTEMIEDEKSSLGSQAALETTLKFLSSKSVSRPSPSSLPSLSAPISAKQRTTEDLRLQEAFQGMELKSSKKVTQDRVYSMVVHPMKERTVVFVGDKRGQLGIWDAESPAVEHEDADGELQLNGSDPVESKKSIGSIWRMQLHASSSISCLKVDPSDGQSLFSTSYDCSFRRLSLQHAISTEIFALQDEDHLINHFDLTPTGQEAWLVDSGGGLSHVDMREGGGRRRWEISGAGSGQRKLGGVSINPSMEYLIATAGNDRCVRIWDSRYFSDIKMHPYSHIDGEDPLHMGPRSTPPSQDTFYPDFEADYDAVQGALSKKAMGGMMKAEYAHGKSCSSAYWDNWGRHLLTTSYDDRLRIFEFDAKSLTAKAPLDGTIKETRSVKHDCQCGRWVTVLKAQWSLNTNYAPHFTVGDMKRRLKIYSSTGLQLADLGNRDVITAVPAVTTSHPYHVNKVFGGNASGKCQYWAPKEVDDDVVVEKEDEVIDVGIERAD